MASGSSRCPVWQTLRENAVDAVFEERWCLGAGERGNPATVSSHGRSAIESRCWSTPAASTRSWWCCAAPAPSDAAAGWVATIVGVDGPLVDARPAADAPCAGVRRQRDAAGPGRDGPRTSSGDLDEVVDKIIATDV